MLYLYGLQYGKIMTLPLSEGCNFVTLPFLRGGKIVTFPQELIAPPLALLMVTPLGR